MDIWNLILSLPAVVLLIIIVMNVIIFFAIICLFSINKNIKALLNEIRNINDEQHEDLKDVKELLDKND